MNMPLRSRHRPPLGFRQAARGAAALVVVMVLFFIVALVAAYTSRNLIFEQRTSANQYRSTQAFEAAEAGLEWALAMLNSGRIDETCLPRTDPAIAGDSFRQRYLSVDPDSGLVDVRTRSDGQPLRPACVFDGTDWKCSCPLDGAAVLDAPVGAGPFPAFVLRFFRNDPPYPPGSAAYPAGVVRIESTGCTRLDADNVCAPTTASGDGRATVTIVAAMKSALSTPPTAAVTVHGDLQRSGSTTLRASNLDVDSGGITLHAGDAPAPDPPRLDLQSLPGTPPARSVFNDAQMAGLDAGRMFASVFGIARDTYRLQPAAVYINCIVDCSAATVRDLAALNPGRVLWIDGNFAVNINDAIGTAASPVLLVVTGNVETSSAGAQLHGVVYTVGNRWVNTGALTLTGALIGEGDLDFSGNGTNTISYDPSVLKRLRNTHGSFVRVPGSWRDF
jgi:hypothetical protein